MFQFSGFPSHDYVFIIRYLDITLSEFPHSEIFGSKFTCNSPKLIAAYHVLHRLLMPRHSPCALCSLTYLRLIITFVLLRQFRRSFAHVRKYIPPVTPHFLVLLAPNQTQF